MRTAYLFTYNMLQFAGWAAVLATGRMDLLMFFQTLQFIEVLHCMFGLVKSSAIQTFMQILSRIIVVWVALVMFPATRQSFGLYLILWAWPLAETTRYIYYALNLISLNLYLVTWLRYTLFIFLYPMGVTGELLILYKLMAILKETNDYNFSLPNRLNFSLHSDVALLLYMLTYIPFFPQLYFYMLGQRKKFLGPQKSADTLKSTTSQARGHKSD